MDFDCFLSYRNEEKSCKGGLGVGGRQGWDEATANEVREERERWKGLVMENRRPSEGEKSEQFEGEDMGTPDQRGRTNGSQ